MIVRAERPSEQSFMLLNPTLGGEACLWQSDAHSEHASGIFR